LAEIIETILMYGYVIVAGWLILMVVWVVGAFKASRDISSGLSIVRWLWQLFLLRLLIFYCGLLWMTRTCSRKGSLLSALLSAELVHH